MRLSGIAAAANFIATVAITSLAAEATPPFSIQEITPDVAARMQYSWKDNNPVPLSDLRHLLVQHVGFDGNTLVGELIIHKNLAEEVLEIFKEVFEAGYPIEKIQFVDVYQGVDENSAADNNSYSFCSRENTSIPGQFSKHSYGTAVDINPFFNPYHKGSLIIPIEGAANLDRSLKVRGMIQEGDALHQAFKRRGWTWGGEWPAERGYADWHHFEKDPKFVITGS